MRYVNYLSSSLRTYLSHPGLFINPLTQTRYLFLYIVLTA